MVHLPELLPIVLVPGGLYDDPPVTATDFWVTSGVASALSRLGVEFTLHERPKAPRSWAEEADALAGTIRGAGYEKAGIVAGSNGCSAALRLAIDHPELTVRTMLCWPATAADPVIDELARIIITDAHDADVASALLDGAPIRGVTIEGLAALSHECVVYPSLPENKIHQRATVFELLDAIPDSILVGGSPEPPDDAFGTFVETFASVIAAFSRVEYDD